MMDAQLGHAKTPSIGSQYIATTPASSCNDFQGREGGKGEDTDVGRGGRVKSGDSLTFFSLFFPFSSWWPEWESPLRPVDQ